MCIFTIMNTMTSPPRRKPGPHPKGYKRQHVFLPPQLAEWAKDQEGGLSGLVRRLLDAEQKRLTNTDYLPR
jgi:hypothetical protein